MRRYIKRSIKCLASIALVAMTAVIATALADSNDTGSSINSSLENVSVNNQTLENISVNNQTSNGSRTAEVAAYVYNDDDDSADVSLYIDSIPKGKVDVDKGSEELIGNYTLDTGIHRFKIIWKDPDTEKPYESEVKREVSEDDIVRLYTTEHTEPQKFDVLVSVKNENDNKTDAYLYVDGKFQKSQELEEKEITEFSEVSVEEGVHDISLKWLDPGTNVEYEKKKRVTVDDDKAVVFVATKGISFGESISSPASSTSSEAQYEPASYEPASHEPSEPSHSSPADTATDSSGSVGSEAGSGEPSGSSASNGPEAASNSSIGSNADTSSNATAVTGESSSSNGGSFNDGSDGESSTITNDGSGKEGAGWFAGISLPQGIFSSRIKELPGIDDASSPDPGGETAGTAGDISPYPIVYIAVLVMALYLVFRR